MIGNSPLVGGTTVIPANLSAISLQLLNPDGSVFTNVPFAPFEQLILNSPNFEGASYSLEVRSSKMPCSALSSLIR